jgi:hypothetical protein
MNTRFAREFRFTNAMKLPTARSIRYFSSSRDYEVEETTGWYCIIWNYDLLKQWYSARIHGLWSTYVPPKIHITSASLFLPSVILHCQLPPSHLRVVYAKVTDGRTNVYVTYCHLCCKHFSTQILLGEQRVSTSLHKVRSRTMNS